MTEHKLGPLVLWTDGLGYTLWLEDEYKIAGGAMGPNGTLVADAYSVPLSAGLACDVVEVMRLELERRA
jgi:hypothetical protein